MVKSLQVTFLIGATSQPLLNYSVAQTCDYEWDVSIGNPGMDYEVASLAVHDDGTGPALFAGGRFRSAGGNAAMRIAKWDGQSWSPLGTGIGGDEKDYASYVYAMTSFDDGHGPALFAGGDFNRAGDQAAMSIAFWRDGQWSTLGFGLRNPGGSNGIVNAMAAYDDGSGPALYVGGTFNTAGGRPVSNIARWDGQSWSALGSGVNGWVKDMAVFDDGTGPALYVTGRFYEKGGISIVQKWNGRGWTRMPGGAPRGEWENYSPCPTLFCPVYLEPDGDALGVFDDGNGDALYLTGYYTRIGRSRVSDLAAWSNRHWASLAGGDPSVGIVEMLSFDDGSGPALYVGGWFEGIARWNGNEWSELGDGITAFPVFTMAGYDDGSGNALYIAGAIKNAGGQPTHNIARWKCSD